MDRSDATVLLRVTADESALLQAYRRSCTEHQEKIRLFADSAASRCTSGASTGGAEIFPFPSKPKKYKRG